MIGEGEIFGYENKKGEPSSLFTEKHLFNAQCIENNTLVFRLKV